MDDSVPSVRQQMSRPGTPPGDRRPARRFVASKPLAVFTCPCHSAAPCEARARYGPIGPSSIKRLGQFMQALSASAHAPLPSRDRDADGVIRMSRPPSFEALRRLTPRRREVLELMALGYSNARIARELTVTEAAVDRNISLIFDALVLPPDRDAHRRVKAVVAYLLFASNLQSNGIDDCCECVHQVAQAAS